MEELLKELQTDLEAELAPELHNDTDKALLSSKIKSAYREIKLHRNYQKHHTQEFINADMEKMYSVIRHLSIYDWNLIGAEGETSHSENGTSRAYADREKCFFGVVPFANVT